MNKILIAGRTGHQYVKFKVEKASMRIVKKMLEDFGSDYLEDNQVMPRTYSNYEKWKDRWIPIRTKKVKADIICGDKYIHLLLFPSTDIEFFNAVVDKYSEWIKPKKKTK